MLPDDFRWDSAAGGRRVVFGHRIVALLTPLDGGRCRVETNPHTTLPRTRFFDSCATGQRYLEAWAAKWEGRLRAEGGGPLTLYGGGGSMSTPTNPPATTHRRRRRSR